MNEKKENPEDKRAKDDREKPKREIPSTRNTEVTLSAKPNTLEKKK